MGVKAIIFDLGGIIINLQAQACYQEFASRVSSKGEFDEIVAVCHRYEQGEVNDSQFLALIAHHASLSKNKAKELWNSMLLNIPKERIKLIQELKKTHRVYLLSNTNKIHVDTVNQLLQKDFGINSLDQLFHDVFLSYELGCRKPDQMIYKKVLSMIPENANECLFIDDAEENAKGAEKVGIKGVYINTEIQSVNDWFASQFELAE